MSQYCPPPRRPPPAPGKPSITTCPPGQRWPWCQRCERFAASIGVDAFGNILTAYVRPERARELGWLRVRFTCPQCLRGKTLGMRTPHPLEPQKEIRK